jgi:hypothetical protein
MVYFGHILQFLPAECCVYVGKLNEYTDGMSDDTRRFIFEAPSSRAEFALARARSSCNEQ